MNHQLANSQTIASSDELTIAISHHSHETLTNSPPTAVFCRVRQGLLEYPSGLAFHPLLPSHSRGVELVNGPG